MTELYLVEFLAFWALRNFTVLAKSPELSASSATQVSASWKIDPNW